jgi:hypothetical protein
VLFAVGGLWRERVNRDLQESKFDASTINIESRRVWIELNDPER